MTSKHHKCANSFKKVRSKGIHLGERGKGLCVPKGGLGDEEVAQGIVVSAERRVGEVGEVWRGHNQ